MIDKFPIVILLSGNGSNLQAIIDTIDAKMLAISIKAVISDNPDAYGLERAKHAQIPTQILSPQSFANRTEFDKALHVLIERYEPKLVVLAGFMRLLSIDFVEYYSGKLINIHPSLLPKFKGLNTHQRALEAGETQHGCTVHFVSAKMDEGPIIAQLECPIMPGDTPEILKERVHALEHKLYPDVIHQIADGQIN